MDVDVTVGPIPESVVADELEDPLGDEVPVVVLGIGFVDSLVIPEVPVGGTHSDATSSPARVLYRRSEGQVPSGKLQKPFSSHNPAKLPSRHWGLLSH